MSNTPIPAPVVLAPIKSRLVDVETGKASKAELEQLRADVGSVEASSVLLGGLDKSFSVPESKNKYDPALAFDGGYYHDTTGAQNVGPTWARSGLIPVKEGNRYTLSSQLPRVMSARLHFWGAAGVSQYFGNNNEIPGASVVYRNSNREVSFTIPEGSGIRFVGINIVHNTAHTTADFEATRSKIQLEIGEASSAFEAYGTRYPARLLETGLPVSLEGAASRIGSLETQAKEDFSPVRRSFSVARSKNLYDPATAGGLDGHYYNDSTAQSTPAPGTWGQTGLAPVEEGKTYTLSIRAPYTGTFYSSACVFGASKNPLGTSSTMGLPAGVTATRAADGKSWTFYIAPGSGVRYVASNIFNGAAHTPEQYEEARQAIMLEEGSAVTAFAPFGSTAALLEERLPSSLEGAGMRLEALELARGESLRVVKVGSDFYFRSPFNETKDLGIRFLPAASFSRNNVANWHSTFLLPKEAPATATPSYNTAANNIHGNGDDACPAHYNGTYAGGNHGHSLIVEVTSPGHGKTAADVGSVWADGNNHRFVLMKIIDASTLWFADAEYTKVGDVYTFRRSIKDNLTHVENAANTTQITSQSSQTGGGVQLTPCVKNLKKRVLLNGKRDVIDEADQVFGCTFVDVVNEYEITDLASVVEYVRANAGSNPALDAPEVEAGTKVSVVYRFLPNGACVVFHSFRTLKQIKLAFHGFIQSAALYAPAPRRLFQYIPGTLPIAGETKTWNLANLEEITAGIDLLHFTKPFWANPNNPPSRMVQVLTESDGTPVVGYVIGYSPLKGLGEPSARKNAVDDALFISASEKQYPMAVTELSTRYPDGIVPPGAYFEAVAYRSYFDPKAQPNATVCTYVEDGADVLVFLDYHRSVDFEVVKIPARFRGRGISVVEKSPSFTVHNSVAGSDGILVSVSGGYGFAVLKLGA